MNTPLKPPCTNVGPGGRLISPGGIDLTANKQRQDEINSTRIMPPNFGRRDIKMPDYGDKEQDEEVVKPKKLVGGQPISGDPNLVHMAAFKINVPANLSYMRKLSARKRTDALLEFTDNGVKLRDNIRSLPITYAEFAFFTTDKESAKRFIDEDVINKYDTLSAIIDYIKPYIREEVHYFPLLGGQTK